MARGVVFKEPSYKSKEERDYFSNGSGIVINSQVYNTGGKTLGKVNASEMTYTNWSHTSGYITYKWTETQGNTTSSSTTINATKPVSLEFNQAKSGGAINIGNGGNVYFMDTVQSAANLREGKKDTSAINVTATGEVKTLGNARLFTNNLTAMGKTIDLAHGAMSDVAMVNLTSKGGDITLVSDKGDLAIKNVVINNAPDNGKISLTAEGSIVNADTSALVSAPAITLTSVNGGIGTAVSPLQVKAGSTVTSSNLKNSSLTATARKDINMVQTEGDMRIVRIESKEGDVTLEAKNGSIVDANGGVDTIDSSAEERIARWKELGMISDADGDDSHAAAAKASKEKKLSAIESRFNQLALTDETKVYGIDETKLAEYKRVAGEYNAYLKDLSERSDYDFHIIDTYQHALTRPDENFFKRRGYNSEEAASIFAYARNRNDATNEAKLKELAKTVTETIKTPGIFTVDASRVSAYKAEAVAYVKDAGIVKARQEYISAMQAATTDAARDAARARLQAAKDAYFNGKGFTADEQKAIADYGDLSVSDNYGWSKNELLYAIQDGIVNAKPGVIDIVNTPNVSGKNITLLSSNGGIGNDEAAKYIKNEDITKAENMKLLASARAGDLTWDTNGVTVRRQVPVTIDVAEGGEVQLNGKTNVYVSATEDSALNLKGGIDTDGDIRLSAGKGISIADGTMIRGRNLTLLGGAGDIGASDKYLEMMINGWLMANSGNSIYVHQNGNVPLTLLSVAAGMDAYLHADNGIRMYNGYGMDMGYIRAGRLIDLFTKQGNIWDVRVLANGAIVKDKALMGKIRLINVGGELKIDATISGTGNASGSGSSEDVVNTGNGSGGGVVVTGNGGGSGSSGSTGKGNAAGSGSGSGSSGGTGKGSASGSGGVTGNSSGAGSSGSTGTGNAAGSGGGSGSSGGTGKGSASGSGSGSGSSGSQAQKEAEEQLPDRWWDDDAPVH